MARTRASKKKNLTPSQQKQSPAPPNSTPKMPPVNSQAPAPPSKEDQQLVQNYISGKLKAPNPTLEYLVGQLRETMAEGDVLHQNILQAEQQLVSMKKQLMELQGSANQGSIAVLHFHKEANS
jgi:hypothetical protein